MEIIELEKEDVLLTSCTGDCSEYSSVQDTNTEWSCMMGLRYSHLCDSYSGMSVD